MFLKVKHVAGKQYFALCQSVRSGDRVVTKTIRSLGNKEKALVLLQSDYPNFLNRYYEIVGTKTNAETNKCRDNNLYGLWCVEENEFFRIYSSGMSMGLFFKYDSYEAAEAERKKYAEPNRFIVKKIPNELVSEDRIEFQRRLDAMYPKKIVPTNLKLADMSSYQRNFEQKVIAAHKDYSTKGTRIILETNDSNYVMAFLYDSDNCSPYLFDKDHQNCNKKHWVIDRWYWESAESYKNFMCWYDDLLD